MVLTFLKRIFIKFGVLSPLNFNIPLRRFMSHDLPSYMKAKSVAAVYSRVTEQGGLAVMLWSFACFEPRSVHPLSWLWFFHVLLSTSTTPDSCKFIILCGSYYWSLSNFPCRKEKVDLVTHCGLKGRGSMSGRSCIVLFTYGKSGQNMKHATVFKTSPRVCGFVPQRPPFIRGV
jgi:hypothetical protein